MCVCVRVCISLNFSPFQFTGPKATSKSHTIHFNSIEVQHEFGFLSLSLSLSFSPYTPINWQLITQSTWGVARVAEDIQDTRRDTYATLGVHRPTIDTSNGFFSLTILNTCMLQLIILLSLTPNSFSLHTITQLTQLILSYCLFSVSLFPSNFCASKDE